MSVHLSIAQLRVEFVRSAESITDAQDQTSFNAVQNALRKLLLDCGYDLAEIARNPAKESPCASVQREHLFEVLR